MKRLSWIAPILLGAAVIAYAVGRKCTDHKWKYTVGDSRIRCVVCGHLDTLPYPSTPNGEGPPE